MDIGHSVQAPTFSGSVLRLIYSAKHSVMTKHARHILEGSLHFRLDVLCDFAEQLCALIVIHYRRRRASILHNIPSGVENSFDMASEIECDKKY